MLATETINRKPARFPAEPGGLTAEQLAQFQKEGYVVIDGLLDPSKDLDPIIAEYATVLDRLAQELFDAGQITSTYADLPFSERLTMVYAESGKVHAQYFDFSLPQAGVQHDTPFWTGPAVFSALTNPAILDAIESIIGGEIYANPVQHVRMKPPEHLTPVDPTTGQVQLGASPWHQDNGVVTEDADETEIITVWFPLTDATVENGCLAVVPRQEDEGLLTHCPSGLGLHIPEDQFRVQDEIPLPMKRGSVLFMHRLTPHRSFSNNSDHVRWSFDLRYNPIGQPTGRAAFPGFIARSRRLPEAELHDPKEWTRRWLETRAIMAESENPKFNRWDGKSPVCA
jgi:phytanoyl-CoA hydroxylase